MFGSNNSHQFFELCQAEWSNTLCNFYSPFQDLQAADLQRVNHDG